MSGPLIGRKDFQLPLDKENNLKEGSRRRTKGKRDISCVLWKEKEEKKSMEKILVLMWENVLFMKRKNMCKQEHGRKLCVAST